MKILCLSDKQVSFIYGPEVRKRFRKLDLVIGCGDLSYYYLEYVLEALNVPLVFVRGNHDKLVEFGSEGLQRTYPHGADDLHGTIRKINNLLFAGIEGSFRYRPGPFQYSQPEMWLNVFRLVPGLIVNRLRYGRYLDIFVTHAPPEGIHDQSDLPHRGIQAFRWFIEVFQPKYHIHGHVHVYKPGENVEAMLGRTSVINSFGFREIEI